MCFFAIFSLKNLTISKIKPWKSTMIKLFFCPFIFLSFCSFRKCPIFLNIFIFDRDKGVWKKMAKIKKQTRNDVVFPSKIWIFKICWSYKNLIVLQFKKMSKISKIPWILIEILHIGEANKKQIKSLWMMRF